MRRTCRLLLLALVGLTAAAQAGDPDGPRILVTFADPGLSNAARAGPPRPGYDRRSSTYLVSISVKRAADRVARDFGLLVVDEWPIVPLNVHCLVFAVGKGIAVQPLLQRLRERPEVESAQLLNVFEVSGTGGALGKDPYSRLQHSVDTLELEQAHVWSMGGGASVTIVDTGADVRHPELVSQIRVHLDFVGTGEAEFDADAHGTAVAGVIGAAADNGVGMVGVAPSASLTVLKACWYTEGRARAVCDSFTLAKALAYAVDSGTEIINLSLGGPSDELLARLVGVALSRGMVVVAAAPGEAGAGFPADVPGVIVAGAAAASGTSAGTSLVAPGEEILVPTPGGGFDYASGSSLSAAHVSGIVALLLAKKPGLSRGDVSRLLVDSRAGADSSVNACRALAELLQRSGCRDQTIVTQTPLVTGTGSE
jgi:subtilisin family serine protease